MLGRLKGMSGCLSGILNGIDTEEWNPATDPHIPARYTVDIIPPPPPQSSVAAASHPVNSSIATISSPAPSVEDYVDCCSHFYHDDSAAFGGSVANSECVDCGVDGGCDVIGVLDYKFGKAACKAALQHELGLHVDPDSPLVGFIGRLDQQKGVDLLLEVVPHIIANGGQVVMLGSGDVHLEGMLLQLQNNHKGYAVGRVGFSVPMAHRITAASDIFAMPSRFEPCGLTQMYALRYGTIPVAHATGGLKDTVRHDVGFPFSPCNPRELRVALDRAFTCYHEGANSKGGAVEGRGIWRGRRRGSVSANVPTSSRWEQKQVAAMRRDLSWATAAEKYETVLQSVALSLPPQPPSVGACLDLDQQHVDRCAAVPCLGDDHACGTAVAAGAVAAQNKEQWEQVSKRAEHVRQRAGRSPDTDTRTHWETTTGIG
jgi:starch synthase